MSVGDDDVLESDRLLQVVWGPSFAGFCGMADGGWLMADGMADGCRDG